MKIKEIFDAGYMPQPCSVKQIQGISQSLRAYRSDWDWSGKTPGEITMSGKGVL